MYKKFVLLGVLAQSTNLISLPVIFFLFGESKLTEIGQLIVIGNILSVFLLQRRDVQVFLQIGNEKIYKLIFAILLIAFLIVAYKYKGFESAFFAAMVGLGTCFNQIYQYKSLFQKKFNKVTKAKWLLNPLILFCILLCKALYFIGWGYVVNMAIFFKYINFNNKDIKGTASLKDVYVFSYPSVLVNTLSISFILVLLADVVSEYHYALFLIAHRVINSPVHLFISNISQIIISTYSSAANTSQGLHKKYLYDASKITILFSTPLCFLLYVITMISLPADIEVIAEYMFILSLILIPQLLVVPFLNLCHIFNKQKLVLIYDCIRLTLLISLIPIILNLENWISAYSALSILLYLPYVLIIYKALKERTS